MTRDRPGHVRAKLADLVTGIAAAVVVFAAVPSVLVGLVGIPLPKHLERATVLSSGGLFDLLAILAWVAWLACLFPLLRSVVARVRRRDDALLPSHPLTEWFATRIAVAVLTLFPIGATLGTAGALTPGYSTSVGYSTSAVHATVLNRTGQPPNSTPTSTSTSTSTSKASSLVGNASQHPQAPHTCVVAPGDSLWSLAAEYYGTGADWPLIARANIGQLMDNGSRFLDPSLILVGWVLQLPATPAPAEPSTPSTSSASTGTPSTSSASTGTPSTSSASAVENPLRPPVHPASSWTGRVATVSPPLPGRREQTEAEGVPSVRRRSSAAHHEPDPEPARPPVPVPLPELAALGVGVLVAGVLARKVRRARRLASMTRWEGETPAIGAVESIDTSTLLAPFDDMPTVEWFETANRLLGATLPEPGGRRGASRIHMVRIGPDGVEVFPGEAGSSGDAREAAEPSSGGGGNGTGNDGNGGNGGGLAALRWVPGDSASRGTWLLPATVDLQVLKEQAEEHDPWMPVSLPLGANARGSWLVAVEPGSVLALLGPAAEGLLAAMRTTVTGWSWSSTIVVTDEVDEAERLAVNGNGGHLDEVAGQVLYIGDPASLSASARRHCAIVTTSPCSDAEVTVFVDGRTATVHPHGIAVRPDLLATSRAEAIDDLVSERRVNASVDDGGSSNRSGDDPHTVSIGEEPARTHLETLGPGPIEVRLLTPTPRIDGLLRPLAPKRARRATELVAYLALHHPGPVTSDLLRTRVLGSAEADAARKTLMNIAATARSAMGVDHSGRLRFPRASRTGLYRLSAEVTADADRAVHLVEEGRTAADPDEAMALLRAALDLVEGEPLVNVPTGYGWWSGEAHERRTASALVDGACLLARLAVAAGHIELARWGLDQARLLDPYSEVLTRAAMRLAAQIGDIDSLRREWADCRRRVDELDPGSLPSEATERLYAHLRRAPTASGLVD